MIGTVGGETTSQRLLYCAAQCVHDPCSRGVDSMHSRGVGYPAFSTRPMRVCKCDQCPQHVVRLNNLNFKLQRRKQDTDCRAWSNSDIFFFS